MIHVRLITNGFFYLKVAHTMNSGNFFGNQDPVLTRKLPYKQRIT